MQFSCWVPGFCFLGFRFHPGFCGPRGGFPLGLQVPSGVPWVLGCWAGLLVGS